MRKIELKNERLVFAILLIALFIVFILYYNFVFSEVLARNSFANQMIEIADENENPILVFKGFYYIVVQMLLIIQMIYL